MSKCFLNTNMYTLAMVVFLELFLFLASPEEEGSSQSNWIRGNNARNGCLVSITTG